MPASALTEGEAWTRERLRELLARRFSPAAVARFLAASQRRADRIRRARPELARRERAWIAAGFAGWAGLAAGSVEPFRRRLRHGVAGWALTGLVLDWHLGMVETEDGRPRNLGPADAATLLRAWLAPAVAEAAAPGLCLLGFASDVLDGPLARAGEPTRLGRDLEGLVDAAFTTAALRGARRRGLVAPAAARAEAARLLVGFGYAVAVYLGRARPPDEAVLRAARVSAPLRAGGILLAGSGRRRAGTGLLAAGSLAGVAPTLRRAVAAEASRHS